MTILSDDFSVDTGQITISGYNGNPPTTIGTAVITSGQLLLTIPPSSGAITYVGAQENTWPITSPSLFAWSIIGSPTFNPSATGQANFANGIIKDANHWLIVECGFISGAPTTLHVFVAIMAGGAQVTLASTTVNIASLGLPDKIGIGLVNNIATAWLSFSGTWQQVTTVGSGGNVDVSAQYDFTAGGALTGWNPGAAYGQINVPISSQFACDFLQYIAPFASPITGATVPNVLTETLSAATADILVANLIVGTVTSALSADPAGTVISQTPTGGSSAVLGSAVDLVLSAGEATVPNVVGDTQAAATTAILAANLVVGTVTFVANPAPAGTVISQNPFGGTIVAIGSAVNLVIASVDNKSVYGKFVGSAVYPPVLLINAPEIEPRVWMPKENVRVKS